ncbi:hypothetical protein [Corynebacterium flavescens]|uniref:hypothetical protein n=1 Tax=Corynebacterium flavescens TaxID=28028 RepID=UPI000EC3E7C3|nr:hypothetical protein [Corynebacterium flavescens]MDN6098919.1 hypothetical protein [Corynebacterium flavescens]MDN6199215.1 hypothetical protein [Corynebacterium flavescens]MDN6226395.1 hypothetical protein [Corynebacterium flavescens]MDN6236465.1 hypothetical protein [Corynebacterium flavescens]MDN6431176.1 hypothetical protein [Corynebacterium flavescens]
MRIPSFRLGFSVLAMATLLSGPAPALAYEPHNEGEDSCRVSYDRSQTHAWGSAAEEVYNIAQERKGALSEFGVLSPQQLQHAFDFYFGEERVANAIRSAQGPANKTQALTEYPWALSAESVKAPQRTAGPSEKQVLDYLGALSSEFLKLRVSAQPGLHPSNAAQAPTPAAGANPAAEQFPQGFPDYAAALDRAQDLGGSADKPCTQEPGQESQSTAQGGENAPAVPESFFGPLAAVFGGTAAATAAIASVWGSLDWTSILTALGSLI